MMTSSFTHQGRVRKQNEDSLLVCPEIGLFAVADGIGGHQAGEVASAEAVRALREAFKLLRERGVGSEAALAEAIIAANTAVWKKAHTSRDYSGMGTTLTAAVVTPTRLLLSHVGDSRCYVLHTSPSGRKLFQVTVDQNDPLGRLIGAIGVDKTVHPVPGHYELAEGDVVLLCTDGLFKASGRSDVECLSAEAIMTLLSRHDAAEVLLDAALNSGGADNVSGIVIGV